jgi:hypothetical protein
VRLAFSWAVNPAVSRVLVRMESVEKETKARFVSWGRTVQDSSHYDLRDPQQQNNGSQLACSRFASKFPFGCYVPLVLEKADRKSRPSFRLCVAKCWAVGVKSLEENKTHNSKYLPTCFC